MTAKIGNIDTRIRLDSSTMPPIVAQPRPIDWRILPNAQTLVARYDTLLTTRQRNTMQAGTTLQAVTVTARNGPVQQRVFKAQPSAVISRAGVMSNGVGGMLSAVMPRYLEYRIIKYSKPDIKDYVDDVLQQGRLEMNDMAVGEIDHIDIHERNADTMMYKADIIVAIYTIRNTNPTRTPSAKSSLGQRVVLKGFQRNLASK